MKLCKIGIHKWEITRISLVHVPELPPSYRRVCKKCGRKQYRCYNKELNYKGYWSDNYYDDVQ